MAIVWSILLALMAEGGVRDGTTVRDGARPLAGRSIRAELPTDSPVRSMSVAKKGRHRSFSGLGSWSAPEEFDTEEVDESWMVHLDGIATIPACWLPELWSRARSSPRGSKATALALDSHFPLRC